VKYTKWWCCCIRCKLNWSIFNTSCMSPPPPAAAHQHQKHHHEQTHWMFHWHYICTHNKITLQCNTPSFASSAIVLVRVNGQKEEKRRNLHTKKIESRTWATTLSKTDPSWPSGHTSRHAKASSGKGYISLQQLALNTFKHVISQI
jgi:hypothetical protein